MSARQATAIDTAEQQARGKAGKEPGNATANAGTNTGDLFFVCLPELPGTH